VRAAVLGAFGAVPAVEAVEPMPGRRERVRALGATDVLDPADGDVVEQIRDLTGGRGVDVAFEAAADVAAVRAAFDATRRGGIVVPLGMVDRGVTVDLPRFARVLEARLLDPAAMVDRTFPLADAGKALGAAADRELITAVLLPQT
jgi:threonine dehydrogenase-like Zn-dependent dehydrogenase